MKNFSTIPPLDATAVLKRFGLRADKSLGQNFLQDASALESIALAAEIQADDCVLEIGPGLGSLTRYLASAAKEVTAVELDADMIAPLKAVLTPHPNVRVVQGDILKTTVSELIHTPDYLVVANIPYYITSAIMRHLLEGSPTPRRIVLTIQKEVAERICAAPGDLSLLALSVQVYGRPSIAGVIPAAAFHPAPKVDSAILRVDIYPEPLIRREMLPSFFKLTKAGFSQKRKTLRNSLSSGLHIKTQEAEALLTSAGIDFMRRAETLSIEEWEKLCERWVDSSQ
jgi:16S rRNA (adenine1518-N6/adenine1519-N6)-dimethyltransferase